MTARTGAAADHLDRLEDVDVVVVGSGGAALTGAWAAVRHGLRTVVLEKTPFLGGTSAYSGGACWLPGTQVQRRAGSPDSTDSARRYLSAILSDPDTERIEAFLAHAPALVAALESDPDMAWEPVAFPEYFDAPGRVPGGRSIQPVAVARDDLPPEIAALIRPPVERDREGRSGRRTLTGGQALVGRLATMVARDGGTLLTEAAVTGLVTEGGRVVGVAVSTAAGTHRLRARRGVLLAAGGFEGDAAMRTEHHVPGSAAWTMGPRGTNRGEVIRAALELGAAGDFGPLAWFCPGVAQPDGSGSFVLGLRSGIVVDQDGHRYANECLPYDRFGRAMAAAPERVPSWLIFDNREQGRLPAIGIPDATPEEHLAAGTWLSAPDLTALADAAGLPADALAATVDRFNRAAEQGHDADFGRGADEYDTFFAGGGGPRNAALVPLDRAPFFAARLVLCDLGTKGGLVVDATGRVLRSDGTVIDGLFAAGNTAASMFGSVYPGPGAPLGSGMVTASLAVGSLLAGR